MAMKTGAPYEVARRAVQVVLDVLPRSATADVAESSAAGYLIVNGQPLEIEWAGEGGLRHVRRVLERDDRGRNLVVAGRRLSPGARELLSEREVGWADETGAAEIAVRSLVISRTGRSEPRDAKPRNWTGSALAVAEAVLCGTKGTVEAVRQATGLSTGSCTNALRFLADLGLLESEAARGRVSARQVADSARLLDDYVSAAEAARSPLRLTVGVSARDIVGGLVEAGQRWDKAGVAWASTGAAAASAIAPYLTAINTCEVYVAADTMAGLEATAVDAGLRPIEGGRLTLRPFPTAAVRKLATVVRGLRVAPWPRVYVDLRSVGVRGEEAAEHLRDVVNAR